VQQHGHELKLLLHGSQAIAESKAIDYYQNYDLYSMNFLSFQTKKPASAGF